MEATPIKSITQDKIIAFLTENIIIIFGVPQWLIMDDGPNIKGNNMKDFYKKFYIM